MRYFTATHPDRPTEVQILGRVERIGSLGLIHFTCLNGGWNGIIDEGLGLMTMTHQPLPTHRVLINWRSDYWPGGQGYNEAIEIVHKLLAAPEWEKE